MIKLEGIILFIASFFFDGFLSESLLLKHLPFEPSHNLPIQQAYFGLDENLQPKNRPANNTLKLNPKKTETFDPSLSKRYQHSDWDIKTTLKFLRSNARSESQGLCAKYVRLALARGGIIIQGVRSAKNLGKSLLASGFKEIPITDNPLAGDIAVIQPYPGGIDGHSAMFDGEQWISDFVQQELYPGPSYRASKPTYVFYRLEGIK